MTNKWKTIAIIFVILFLLENAFLIYGVKLSIEETSLQEACYYETCKDYPQALLEDGLCTCYNWNDEIQDFVPVE